MTDTKCVTVAVTVTASGKILPPFIVFKGAPNKRIAKQEFGTYPTGGKYACQQKAWMDETLIEAVLKPYTDKKDAWDLSGPPPILILNAYRVHQMGSVVNCIQ